MLKSFAAPLSPLRRFLQPTAKAARDGSPSRRPVSRGRRLLVERLEDRSLLSAIPLGSEFRVNTTTSGDQVTGASNRTVAMSASGDFVVTWASNGQDGGGWGIYAQRYGSSGVAQGSEFRVNTYTTGDQDSSSVAMDQAGNFVIVWTSRGQDGSAAGVYAQRYNAAGVAQGSEFRLNTITADEQTDASVAMDADGDFVVSWSSGTLLTYDIYARRYNAAGVAQDATEFLVNTYTTTVQYFSSVAIDASGNFVVAWFGRGPGDTAGIFARRYNAAGVAQNATEFRVNTYTTGTQWDPAVAMNAAGDFVIAWDSAQEPGSLNFGVYAQRYNASGVAQGGEIHVNSYPTGNQSYAGVAIGADGSFVVTWESIGGQDGSSTGVYAQIFSASGDTLGGEFRVNSYTTNYQMSAAVAMDADGDFVVAWTSYGQDAYASRGVYAQRYGLFPPKVGPEFHVNTFTTWFQTQPTAAMNANGDFVLAWTSSFSGQDGSDDGVFAQRYNAAGIPQGGEFQVNSFGSSGNSVAWEAWLGVAGA